MTTARLAYLPDPGQGHAGRRTVLDLDVLPDQRRWVRPVSWYVARSAYQTVWTPVAITVGGGVVVGFAEWAYDDSDATHCIGGVVIDARHRGNGYGKAGMRALVAYLRQRPGCAPGDGRGPT